MTPQVFQIMKKIRFKNSQWPNNLNRLTEIEKSL